jgi:hypothetical protein
MMMDGAVSIAKAKREWGFDPAFPDFQAICLGLPWPMKRRGR